MPETTTDPDPQILADLRELLAEAALLPTHWLAKRVESIVARHEPELRRMVRADECCSNLEKQIKTNRAYSLGNEDDDEDQHGWVEAYLTAWIAAKEGGNG